MVAGVGGGSLGAGRLSTLICSSGNLASEMVPVRSEAFEVILIAMDLEKDSSRLLMCSPGRLSKSTRGSDSGIRSASLLNIRGGGTSPGARTELINFYSKMSAFSSTHDN